ncbi:glycoside hydrolase family 16 protein [Fomitiporia mediterranea MF3/22]|uniref:glycoside hydrolase family 16 protein n=1 Tax=Fomitiporia mediterranea (strain MF3/22) TaxID=694068 RepID=UPI00044076DE|nr:glycoside hydrolase family 16 protein [Fomitiporia mediterranea MF3/22]EJD08578.1 glycoside hydrolase family 16 protein [Fomitiporia mediterranea MF3/22]
MHQGNSFFDGFDFFTDKDPTNGQVKFLSRDAATGAKLAFVQDDGTTVMAVDNTSNLGDGENRNSVRIQSKKTYSSGLIVADIYAMPHGCSVWPAFWMVGSDWPNNGEIDILEGVNDGTNNQYTLHTADGCALDKSPAVSTVSKVTGKVEAFASNVLGTTCASSAGNNAGCAFLDTSTTSYGHGFNMLAGGVFATLIDDSGISIYRFERSSIPGDLQAQKPDPSSWGVPAAFWSSSTCDIQSHFKDMNIVFDTTLCGDWAGAAFPASCPGTCSDAVKNASNFDFAQWKVNSVAVYQ